MDWLIWITQLLILGCGVMIYRLFRRMNLDLEKLESFVVSLRSRQSQIKARRGSSATPQVDAKARTVIRDSADLPTTGRMSTGVHRRKSNATTPVDD